MGASKYHDQQWINRMRTDKPTPDSDSDLSRRGYDGPPARLEFIEFIEPLGPAFAGGGDCVCRSPALSSTPFSTVEAVVPSEVWILRLAGGRPVDGALFFDLNRNAMADVFLVSQRPGICKVAACNESFMRQCRVPVRSRKATGGRRARFRLTMSPNQAHFIVRRRARW